MSELPKEARGMSRARQVRRDRARRLAIRFAIVVGIPTLLSIVYYGWVATPQYESIAIVSVQSSKGPMAGLGMLAAIIPMATSGRDTILVREYVRSRDMMQLMDENHRMFSHYRNPDADWWSRLASDANSEDRYKYYRDKVGVHFSSKANTLTLRIRAYSGEKAQAFATAILGYAEQMVNRMSDRARQDRIKLAKSELAIAETRLTKVRKRLTRLRSEHGIIDPATSATAVVSVEHELEMQLVKAQVELDTLQTSLRAAAPRVIQARRRVSSLRSRLAKHKKKMSSTTDDAMARTASKFEATLLEQKLSQRVYTAALGSLELARIEASRQQRYLVTISSASLPDVATYPRRLWSIATVFFVALALMGIFSLLSAAAREHAKI